MPLFERYEAENETEGDMRVRHLGERVRLGGGPGFLAKSAANVVPAFRVLASADLPAVSRPIPVFFRGATVLNAAAGQLPDEDAANLVVVSLVVPPTWSGGDITMTSTWFADSTGVIDLQEQANTVPRTAGDQTFTSIIATQNNNITISTNNRYQTITTTLSAASLSIGLLVIITFNRGTGDANTGSLWLQNVTAVTGQT